MLTCAHCGNRFPRRPGRGAPAMYCRDECRLASRRIRERGHASRRALCAGGCGGTVWTGRTSLPAGEATCGPCRKLGLGTRKAKPPQRKVSCVLCGKTLHNAHNYWCWPCSVANRIPGKGRDVEKRRIHDRRYRERARRAPGLSQYGIHALLATWKQQRRACTYCPSLATSVDHVIPLALGGTNYEGNLTPACGPCNRRKNDDLLIVWRRKLSEAVA